MRAPYIMGLTWHYCRAVPAWLDVASMAHRVLAFGVLELTSWDPAHRGMGETPARSPIVSAVAPWVVTSMVTGQD